MARITALHFGFHSGITAAPEAWKIARHLHRTLRRRQQADAPFSFVAACKEWVAASEAGPEYVTRLPIALDASCNGLQHLAALSRDEITGALTNLMDSPVVQDAYREIMKRVKERIEGEKIVLIKGEAKERQSALFWLNRLNRKLIKRPASTFGYSVTAQGMRDQIVEEYRRQHENNEPRDTAAWYLAHRVMDACRELFKRPAEVMGFICDITEHLANHNLPLRWNTPTGFPVINGYYLPNTNEVANELRGERVRFKIADGWKPTIDAEKAVNAAAPNFVHSLDASHAARVINAAFSDDITRVALIHDSFASLAPDVQRFQQIVRKEFYVLHALHDPLAQLRDQAYADLWSELLVGPLCDERTATATRIYLEPMPSSGVLDLAKIQTSEYMTS